MAKYTDSEQFFLKTFGSALRELRCARGLSQENFALKCGMKRAYIGQIERGLRNVCMVNIVKISKALDVHASIFFKDKLFSGKWPVQKNNEGTANENKII